MLATGTLYVHKRVLAHEHTCIHTYTAAFQEKDCSPESFLSEKRNGGAYSTVTARPCSPAPASETNQHWHQSLFSCRSCPVPLLICGSITPTAALHPGLQTPLGCEPGPPLPFHCPSDSAISHGQRTVSSEPGMQRGNFKRALQSASEFNRIVLLSY